MLSLSGSLVTDGRQSASVLGAARGGDGDALRRRDPRSRRRRHSPATPVALGYALVGGLWIVLSDRVVQWIDGPGGTLQTLKGWLFVVVTSGLLWLVLQGYWRARTRAEAQLRETQKQLLHAQRLELLGQLAAGIAHDFNQVLAAVQGYEALARVHVEAGPEDPEEVLQCLDEVRAAVERGSSLSRQLLAFGRRGRPARTEEIDLRRLLEGAPDLLRPFLGPRIAVRCEPPEDRLVVQADAQQLEQILVNLAVNARDAMPEGGELVLCCRRREVKDPLGDGLGDLPPGPYALLEVADRGAGMDEATLERIFEPFFTTKPEGVGTGLGLPVVYGIVERHGGCISVWSRPGEGSTFCVHLPLPSGPGPSRRRPAPADRAGHPAAFGTAAPSAPVAPRGAG